MDGINLLFKLQKQVKDTQDGISNVLINGQVDNWDKYQYMVGQLKAYQLVLQEISNLLKDKEQNNDEDDNIHKLKPKN
jgi:uncharacterized protein YutD|tara:strand:- start:1571 stop:1804 length:234 start_codon:yes stop_codon:yes gene_type:complete